MRENKENQFSDTEEKDQELLNPEQARIRKWLEQVRFKRTFIGGVDEADVWKKIAELNQFYEAALAAERARYETLLIEHSVSQQVRKGSEENGK